MNEFLNWNADIRKWARSNVFFYFFILSPRPAVVDCFGSSFATAKFCNPNPTQRSTKKQNHKQIN